MTARTLKPLKQKPIKTPQCSQVVEGSVRNMAWHREHYNSDCCQKNSCVEINGKPYCTQHGGAIALAKWLRGELVEVTCRTESGGFVSKDTAA